MACVAAPPAPASRPKCECGTDARLERSSGCCALCAGYFKGVDDYLVAGGELNDLAVLDRRAPLGFPLALYSGPNGEVGKKSIRALAKLMQVAKNGDRVRRALAEMIDLGQVIADRDLDLAADEWTGELGEWHGPASAWPAFTITPVWRYRERELRLGDYWTVPPCSMREWAVETSYFEMGESLEEAVDGWYASVASARRQFPHLSQLIAARHATTEALILALAARGRSPQEIVATLPTVTGWCPPLPVSVSTVRRVIQRGDINPRWLKTLEPSNRDEFEAAVARVKEGIGGRMEA